MPLTPIDVQQKTFATALRGYDLDEVDDFLDAVVVALKDYDQRLTDAQERISTLEAELNDRGDAEGAIARALVAAQRSADAIVADAKEQAEQILADADNEANELADTREAERQRLQAEIDEIRSKVGSVRSSVAELTAAIPATLDEIDEVLESHSADSVGATFDAAEPVGTREIGDEAEPAEEPEVDEIDLSAGAEEVHGQHIAESEREAVTSELDEAVDSADEEFSYSEMSESDSNEGSQEIPSIEELSQRIDSAFDDLVAEADEVSEGSHRPWEDS